MVWTLIYHDLRPRNVDSRVTAATDVVVEVKRSWIRGDGFDTFALQEKEGLQSMEATFVVVQFPIHVFLT